mgnify:FL=1
MEVSFKETLPTEAPMVREAKEHNTTVNWKKQKTKILQGNHLIYKITELIWNFHPNKLYLQTESTNN